jgi:molybdopterin synthase sulfur carrier subunit
MAKVKIKLYATFRDKYGLKDIQVRCDGSVDSLLKNAGKSLGKRFVDEIFDAKKENFRDDRIITINGRNVKNIKKKIFLKDGDEVAIFPPIAGG